MDRFVREGTQYEQCGLCYTIYALTEIHPKTENDNSRERNYLQINQDRINRVVAASPAGVHRAIDFGCGKLDLARKLVENGIHTVGIDTWTANTIGNTEGEVDAVFMVEVIEHLSDPKQVLTELTSKLKIGGVIYIETTFVDQIKAPDTHPYIDPRIGHRTIVSRRGLEFMMGAAGLELEREVNRNVVILRKI